MKPTSSLLFCLLPLLAACPGVAADKALVDDTGEPDDGEPDDSAPPVDTDTSDTGGEETGDDCPELPPLELEALLVNLWTGDWNGVENAGWFRFNEDGTFSGLAHDHQEPAREDYAGTWAANADHTSITLDYTDYYPLDEEGPLAVSQTILPTLTTGTDPDTGCTVPVLEFDWSDFDEVEAASGITGTMSLFLHY